MILFLLGVANEHIVPRRKKMDEIDHILLWTIKVCLVVLFVTLPMALAEELPGDNYWLACSGGDAQVIEQALEQNPGKPIVMCPLSTQTMRFDFIVSWDVPTSMRIIRYPVFGTHCILSTI